GVADFARKPVLVVEDGFYLRAIGPQEGRVIDALVRGAAHSYQNVDSYRVVRQFVENEARKPDRKYVLHLLQPELAQLIVFGHPRANYQASFEQPSDHFRPRRTRCFQSSHGRSRTPLLVSVAFAASRSLRKVTAPRRRASDCSRAFTSA